MKLERLPEYLTIIATITCGMLLSMYLGVSTGGGSARGWQIMIGIVAVVIALIMRANIWLLIPITLPLTGQLTAMPGALPARDVVILYVFLVFLALKALKVVRSKTHHNWLDYMLFLNLAYLATVFVRNPVGTESMGLDRVGGKAYFDAVFIFLGYWVIGHITLSAKLARWTPFLMIVMDIIMAPINTLTYYVPSIGTRLGQVYSGFAVQETSITAVEDTVGRQTYWGTFGTGLIRYLYSRYSPSSILVASLFPPYVLLRPLLVWPMLFSIVGTVAILVSGFRSAFLHIGLFFIVATYFRDGFGRVLRITTICVPILALFLLAQGRLIQLPMPMQRTLSFLPAKWDYEAAGDAIGSTEWRHDIWKNVWESGNKYIQNWWLGDGFSLTKRQLADARRLQDFNDYESVKESLTITGNYHSLPLSAIRAVGYVGLVLFTIFLFSISWYAWRLIGRSKGTPFFVLALFVGVPTIVMPLPSLIMTGFFDNELLGSIYAVAFLRLIDRSLEKYRQEEAEKDLDSTDEFPELEINRFPQHALK